MRLFFAPMEGVVDQHMRAIISAIGGIDLCVTEFVRVNDHPTPKRVFLKYCPELASATNTPFATTNRMHIAPLPTRCPTRVQLLGSNPETLAQSAYIATDLGAPAIDLNFGCPAKTVNRSRGGACLLDDTSLLFDIVQAVRQAVPASIPVTAKIRLGYNERDSYLANAIAIEKAGASEICVHARSKNDGYKPPAYWHYIHEINQALTIPVIANGDIWSLDDFKRCREQSGSHDFMLGRGLLSRPDLALAIKAYHLGQNYSFAPWAEIAQHVQTLFYLTSSNYPNKYMGNRVKQWLFYLSRNYPQAHALFETIKRERDFAVLDMAITQSITASAL